MKFKLVKQQSGKANFTSIQGYITTTRDDLVAVFGEPNPVDFIDDKITTEWIIEFADRTIATIYDWKRGELGAPKDDEVYEWHIGGHRASSFKNVKLVFGESVVNDEIPTAFMPS